MIINSIIKESITTATMLLISILLILIEFSLIMLYEHTLFFYQAYWKISGNKWNEFWTELITGGFRRGIYFGTVFEELAFRLPLFYFTSNFSYYLSLFVFAVSHFDLDLSLFKNLRWMMHAGFSGYLLTQCFLEHGILVSICLHLFINFLSEIVRFPHAYRSQNIRLFLNYLDKFIESREEIER